jgi:transposase
MNTKKKKRSYAEEFKLEAIRLYEITEKSQAEVEEELGMTAGLLSKWISRYRKEGPDAFPGKGNLSGRDEEIYRLKEEIRILKQERDILKKTVSIFSSPK